MKTTHGGIALAVLAMASACFRLSGPPPQPVHTLAIAPPASASAETVAERIRGTSSEVVLLSADRDTAWFTDVAERTGLSLSGPGRTGSRAMAFLTPLELLGDTSIVLGMATGGRIHMHDALFQLQDQRQLDLILVDIEDVTDLREGVRTLFAYIASDVGSNVPVVLGVHAPSTQASDSVTVLMRAFLGNAAECAGQSAPSQRAAGLALLYGPSVRMSCETADLLGGEDGAISARLIVTR